MWNERSSNIALFLELFLIALFLWYAVDIVYVQLRNYWQYTGWNVENTFEVSLKEIPDYRADYEEGIDNNDKMDAIWSFYDRIKEYDGVEAVSISLGFIPGSSVSITENIFSRYGALAYPDGFRTPLATPSVVDVFQLTDPTKDSSGAKQALENNQVVVTTDIIDVLNADVSTLKGDTFFLDDKLTQVYRTIGAMVHPIKSDPYTTSIPSIIMPMKQGEKAHLASYFELCIRVKPEAMNGFEERFTKDMANQLVMSNLQYDGLKYLPKTFDRKASAMRNELFINGFLLIFLLVNILIGVVGVFSNRAQERIGEIGLRISFGATPRGAIRMFIYEGLSILIASFLFALVGVAIIFWIEFPDVDLIPLDLRRYAETMLCVLIIMVLTLVLAIWLPTRKVTHISPAEALREEQ